MHILGPSKNVSRWRCPASSRARAAAGSSPASHRSGLNALASGPQTSSERWMARIGTVTIIPCAIAMRSVIVPSAARMGVLRGTTSSSMACFRGGQSGVEGAQAVCVMVRTTRLTSNTGGCVRSVSCTIASRYGRPFVNCSHVGSTAPNWANSSRSFVWISWFFDNSISAHCIK